MKRGSQHRVDHRRGVDEEGDPSTEGGGGGGGGSMFGCGRGSGHSTTS
jgi:hypothetical protein